MAVPLYTLYMHTYTLFKTCVTLHAIVSIRRSNSQSSILFLRSLSKAEAIQYLYLYVPLNELYF